MSDNKEEVKKQIEKTTLFVEGADPANKRKSKLVVRFSPPAPVTETPPMIIFNGELLDDLEAIEPENPQVVIPPSPTPPPTPHPTKKRSPL